MNLPLTIRSSHSDTTFSCNGSLLAIPLVPERTDVADAVEGSLLHFLIASRLVKEMGAVEPEGGLVAPTLPKGYKLAAFSAWIVDWAVGVVRESVPPDWSLSVEVPLAYRYELPRPVWVPVSEIVGPIPDDHEVKDGMVCIRYAILSGHMDWFAQSPDGRETIKGDWKTGQVGAEIAESNWQVASYEGLCKMAWEDTEKSQFLLAQPRIDEEASGIPRISTTKMTGAQLIAMNGELAEQINRALENRYETNSGQKQCKYCPVAAARPWLCPSLRAEEQFMKATLTPSILEELKAAPNDALLGDFVISGRTLAAPVKAATELLHERIEAQGYLDAGCGTRVTCTTRPGAYEVPDPIAFNEKVKELLPEEERRVRASKYSMTDLKDEIAESRNIPKTSKRGESGASIFDAELRPLVNQGVSKILIFT